MIWETFLCYPSFRNLRSVATFWNGHCSQGTRVLINELHTPFCTKFSPKKPKAYSFYAVPVSCDLAQPSLSEQAAGNIQSVCSSVRNQRRNNCFHEKANRKYAKLINDKTGHIMNRVKTNYYGGQICPFLQREFLFITFLWIICRIKMEPLSLTIGRNGQWKGMEISCPLFTPLLLHYLFPLTTAPIFSACLTPIYF